MPPRGMQTIVSLTAVGRLRRGANSAASAPAFGTARLRWLTASFALASFTFSVMAVHLVTLLTGAGLTPAQAVTVGMLIGPMQVAGRVIEVPFNRTPTRKILPWRGARRLVVTADNATIPAAGQETGNR